MIIVLVLQIGEFTAQAQELSLKERVCERERERERTPKHWMNESFTKCTAIQPLYGFPLPNVAWLTHDSGF